MCATQKAIVIGDSPGPTSHRRTPAVPVPSAVQPGRCCRGPSGTPGAAGCSQPEAQLPAREQPPEATHSPSPSLGLISLK